VRYYVDASVLIALGRDGKLDLLTVLDDPIVLPAVGAEVVGEPEATNLARFIERSATLGQEPASDALERAREILGERGLNGDIALIAAVLEDRENVGVATDDRRVRTVAEGLGASVTGTIGVVVYNVEEDRLDAAEAKRLLRAIDGRGFHMTGALRERADELIEAAEERNGS
jgi:predicted nucleic acid-binding protein